MPLNKDRSMVSKPLFHAQLGFSLMEVMLSILILSIGLLGLGGLQMASVKGANNAHFRTVASLVATDLADRMRANPVAITAGNYESQYVLATCNTPPAKFCEGVVCTPQELASYDLYRVNCGVSSDGFQTGGAQYDLPEAFMSVSCGAITPCTSKVEHTITVRWNEVDDDDEDSNTQLRSYELDFIP